MMARPQSNFRGKQLDFEEFRDLTFIGMAGLTDYLMKPAAPPNPNGMVNYRLVADSLGLTYEPDWLDRLGHELDNGYESIASHDSPSKDHAEDEHWVYLNSGFERIASLLYEKYYVPPPIRDLSYEEFRDVFLFELAGMVQDSIGEDGRSHDRQKPLSYDLRVTADFLNLPHEPDWLARVTSEFLERGFIARSDDSSGSPRYALTRQGYEHTDHLSEKLSAGNGFLLLHGEGTLFFSVDASHISRLGLELVAKQETAVAELVKNGYDADATQVDLIFNTASAPQTSLEIYDNGSGMNIEQLEAGFMRLSTPNKVEHSRSELFARQKAGRKGIGRFAAQRLGRRLVLETTTHSARNGLRLDIDWDEFVANRNLSAVPSKITRIKKPFEHGTRLTILDLRDSWSDAQIERSHRHIAELIQPFPLAAATASGADPGFKASFARERSGDLEIVADDWSAFFRHALAEIEGFVDHAGNASWTLKSTQFGIDSGPSTIGPNKDTPAEPYPHLKNVRFKAYYYIDKETQRAFRSKVADKLQSSGGIRLYRNGFRVLPYGERFDDWLKLNASNLLRKVLPPHSNRNFLGFVEISDVDGTNFEETSSREGLLENESFVELKDFVSAVLKTAILPIAAARDRKLTTTDTRQKQRSPKGQAEELLGRLSALQKNANGDPAYTLALAQVVDAIRSSVIEIGDTGQALLEELGMMRVLATLGLTIGEFTHEIRITLESVKASASLLAASVQTEASQPKQADALLDKIADFEGYLTYFDATVRDNVSREVVALEIRDVVNSFVKVVSPKLNRKELTLETAFQGVSLFTRPMHKSEWASILINLFTNSLKAIRRAGVNGRIQIECGRNEGNIFLDFMDNGDGIPATDATRIFDAFFTTTWATGASAEDGTFEGMGMGLKIVKDIVETARGQIALRPAAEGFSTCFRVSVPEASDEEIPDNAY
ncbi:histidine kinase [Nitrobacter hamburgensis X14]|uniref:histidine kinase n=1 Tax=Nitrobacter hamburgensis (strain DSM 10229 / NCIMB 13809 / X14) TaxID=323097 RepID=Q1QGZ4_NITHX|nr:sensor histidine kinase [Nitrobacter hamburgensis]ABE64503.1 histidine kinase [Nitrobacter hamburgensis X14]